MSDQLIPILFIDDVIILLIIGVLANRNCREIKKSQDKIDKIDHAQVKMFELIDDFLTKKKDRVQKE